MAEKPNILLFYADMIPSVYLCGYVQLEYLQNAGLVNVRNRTVRKVSREDVLWADIVLCVRLDCYRDEWLVRQCRKAGKYLIYVLDDDLLNLPPYLSSYSHYARRETRKRIRNMLSLCHALASPSEELLRKYGQGKNCISIIEPATAQRPEKPPHGDGKIRLGFAGSIDRGRDIDDLLSGALRQITEKYPERVVVEMMGPKTGVSEKLGFKTYPYLDSYAAYQDFMAQLNWDIGLAPMPDTPFHRCKHCNKLVEYAGFGIAGVYSDVIPYAGAVEDGVTGLLCENTEQAWVAAISRLVEDNALRGAIARNCLQRAADVFSVPRAAMNFYEQLPRRAKASPSGMCLPFFSIEKWLVKGISFIRRCIYAIQDGRFGPYLRRKLKL